MEFQRQGCHGAELILDGFKPRDSLALCLGVLGELDVEEGCAAFAARQLAGRHGQHARDDPWLHLVERRQRQAACGKARFHTLELVSWNELLQRVLVGEHHQPRILRHDFQGRFRIKHLVGFNDDRCRPLIGYLSRV